MSTKMWTKDLCGLALAAAVGWTGCTSANPPANPPVAGPNPSARKHEPTAAKTPTDTWLEKLGDAASRARALMQIEMTFEEAFVRANRDRSALEVRRVIDETAVPLTAFYFEQYHVLDVKTRVRTIKLLSSYGDARAEPAFAKAFEEFAKAPPTNRDEKDIVWASRAQTELALERLSMPLFAAFSKLRASSVLGGIAYRDVYTAMMARPDPAWAPLLVPMLEPEIPAVGVNDAGALDQVRDQLFWQTTAAEALGRIGGAAAVEPLFQVLLDPGKADIAYTAELALVKRGRATTDAGIRLLRSEHETLQDFHAKRAKKPAGKQLQGRPWVATAAKVLGATGRREAAAALVSVLETTKDGALVAILASELTRFPGVPECEKAFEKGYLRAPPAAQPELAEAAMRFRDAALVPWLLATASSSKGAPSERQATRAALIETAINLAKPSQFAEVEASAERFALDGAKERIAKLEPLVARCGENARCYLDVLIEPETQNHARRFVGIKAGTMLAVLGDERLRGEIIDNLRPITGAILRHVVAESIDHLTPEGSSAVAEKLDAIIRENAKSPDRDKAAADQSLRQVAVRIRAREN